MPDPEIKALFTDVGGVLLTNGWEGEYRKLAAEKFHLDLKEMDSRHRLAFDTFEIGKLTFDEYLEIVVFYQPRDFSKDDFKAFALAQSKPFPEMIELVRQAKARRGIKVVALSNEGRELNEYRIRKFGLAEFIDVFVTSCFVGLRKPDPAIFRMAMDVAQATPEETIYLDDRLPLVEVGAKLGLRAIHHTGYESTCRAFRELGLA
jgi:putative hydrolase of the HAD superfamily